MSKTRKPKLTKKQRSERAKKALRAGTGGSYNGRLKSLLELGFSSYEEYLASELWAGIRRRVLDRDKGVCRLCKGPANQVHHLWYGYSDLIGKKLSNLKSICNDCHQDVEFEDGKKVSVLKARVRYFLIKRGKMSAAKKERKAARLRESEEVPTNPQETRSG